MRITATDRLGATHLLRILLSISRAPLPITDDRMGTLAITLERKGGRCNWMVEYIDYIVNGISTIHISKSPARSEWKAIYFPSADHVG